MSWTDDQIDRLKDRMADAKKQGTWISAAEAWIVIGLIRFWRRATMRHAPATGMMPTIGDTRAQGIENLYVSCNKCGHTRMLALDELGLPNSTVFVEIPKRRRFKCFRCGPWGVTVMAQWPDPCKAQREGMRDR